MTHIWPNLHNCVKRGFIGKITNTTFFNLLCPIMPKCFKKLCDRSWDIRLNNFGLNWAQILLLLEKEIFWENWLTLLFSIYCAPLNYNVSKKYWQIMRYKVLKFCAKLDTNYPLIPKGDLFLKNLFLSTSDTPSEYYNV